MQRSLDAPFEPYTTTTVRYDPNLSQWTSPLGVDPNVAKNETGNTLNVSVGFVMPAKDFLYFHPGPNGELSVIRWIAPRTGQISVDAVFKAPENSCPTTSDVHVLKNREELFAEVIESGAAKRDIDPRALQKRLTIAQGDQLVFAVGYGSNKTYACDRTLVEAVVTYIP